MVWRARGEERKRNGSMAAIEGRPWAGGSGRAFRSASSAIWTAGRLRGGRLRHEQHTPLGGRSPPNEAEDEIWSLACFFVARPLRGEEDCPPRFHARVATHRSACLLRGVVAIKSPAWGRTDAGPAARSGWGAKKRAGPTNMGQPQLVPSPSKIFAPFR
jgi:hypothetical protein